MYERHLVFDNVLKPESIGPRERYEASARSVRDVLSQRWVRTEETYKKKNPKRIYYLSMEFLMGRALQNNVTNLLLGPVVEKAVKRRKAEWTVTLEQEPDAGLGNGASGVSPPVFSIPWPPWLCLPWAMVFVMNTASSNRSSGTADRWSSPTIGSAIPTPGR